MKKLRLYYLTTLFNDIYFYDFYLAKTGAHLRKFYIIGLSKFNFLFNFPLMFTILVLILFPFIALCYIVSMTFYSVIAYVFYPKQMFSADKIFLCMSNALPEVVQRANLYDADNCWLVNSSRYKLPFKNVFTVYDFIQLSDIIQSALDSILIVIAGVSHFGMKVSLLTLNSYTWLLYYHALKKIPTQTNLYFCNQKDRWALLVDKLPHTNKFLIQHGTEILTASVGNLCKYSANYKFWVQKVPYKSSTFKIVYAFTQKESEAILLSIVENNPRFIYTGYGLKLSERISSKFSVLLIGCYSFNSEREKEIINLLQPFEIELYIKNHPTLRPDFYYKLKEKFEFNIVDNKCYPNVDLVLSYASTLAFEYESLGITVIYYEDHSNEELLLLIRKMLSKYVRGKLNT